MKQIFHRLGTEECIHTLPDLKPTASIHQRNNLQQKVENKRMNNCNGPCTWYLSMACVAMLWFTNNVFPSIYNLISIVICCHHCSTTNLLLELLLLLLLLLIIANSDGLDTFLRHDSLLRDIIQGRMKGKVTRGRKRLQMLSDVISNSY